MEIRFDTREFSKMLEDLSPREVRRLSKVVLGNAAKIPMQRARHAYEQEFAQSKEEKKKRRELAKATGTKVLKRAQGIVSRVAKSGGSAIARIWRAKRRTGKPPLDNAYVLWFLEKGAIGRRYTKKGYNRGVMAPRPFFMPAVAFTKDVTERYIRSQITRGIILLSKK